MVSLTYDRDFVPRVRLSCAVQWFASLILIEVVPTETYGFFDIWSRLCSARETFMCCAMEGILSCRKFIDSPHTFHDISDWKYTICSKVHYVCFLHLFINSNHFFDVIFDSVLYLLVPQIPFSSRKFSIRSRFCSARETFECCVMICIFDIDRSRPHGNLWFSLRCDRECVPRVRLSCAVQWFASLLLIEVVPTETYGFLTCNKTCSVSCDVCGKRSASKTIRKYAFLVALISYTLQSSFQSTEIIIRWRY